MKISVGIAALSLLLNFTPQAFAAGTPGEWWEVTQKMEMPGMPDFAAMMPGSAPTKVCIAPGQASQPFTSKEKDKDCTISDFKQSGNGATFTMKCTGENAMTGTGEITSTPTSFSQKINIHSQDGDMLLVSTGRRVGGACSVEEEMTKLQAETDKAIALSAANSNKLCAVDTKSLDPQMLAKGFYYFDNVSYSKRSPAQCRSEQSAFCAQARKVAGVPAGYLAYDEIRRAFADNPELAIARYNVDPVKACKINPAPLLQNACGIAKKDLNKNNPWDSDDQARRIAFDDWNFITNYCPADAETYYKNACANWQSEKSANTGRYIWCNAVQDWEKTKVTQSNSAPQATNPVNPPPSEANASDEVETSKAKAVQEGVTEGVKNGMNTLKGFFKH